MRAVTKARARVLKNHRGISEIPVLVGGEGAEKGDEPRPEVRLLRDGEGDRIEVRCTCGRCIVIACEYPGAGRPATRNPETGKEES